MLYAIDAPWWHLYGKEAHAAFKGDRVCGAGPYHGAQRAKHAPGLNSGAGALLAAAYYGAERIIMVGYDCQYAADGARHWHGNHPAALGNAGSLAKWPAQFAEVARVLSGVQIVNASRSTALACFDRCTLEEALDVD